MYSDPLVQTKSLICKLLYPSSVLHSKISVTWKVPRVKLWATHTTTTTSPHRRSVWHVCHFLDYRKRITGKKPTFQSRRPEADVKEHKKQKGVCLNKECSYNSPICPCEITGQKGELYIIKDAIRNLIYFFTEHRAVPRNSVTPLCCIYKAKLKHADWPCCSLKTLHQGKYESLLIKE